MFEAKLSTRQKARGHAFFVCVRVQNLVNRQIKSFAVSGMFFHNREL